MLDTRQAPTRSAWAEVRFYSFSNANLTIDMVRMYEAFAAGDWNTALELHYELSPLMRALFIDTNPIPVKKAVGLRGMAAGPVRLPLADLDEEKTTVLAEVLGRYD